MGRSSDDDATERNVMLPERGQGAVLRSGNRAAVEMLRPRHSAVGAPASRYRVASSFGPAFVVAPFASSPFVHSIPQSRRRASGDLFSGYLAETLNFLPDNYAKNY